MPTYENPGIIKIGEFTGYSAAAIVSSTVMYLMLTAIRKMDINPVIYFSVILMFFYMVYAAKRIKWR